MKRFQYSKINLISLSTSKRNDKLQLKILKYVEFVVQTKWCRKPENKAQFWNSAAQENYLKLLLKYLVMISKVYCFSSRKAFLLILVFIPAPICADYSHTVPINLVWFLDSGLVFQKKKIKKIFTWKKVQKKQIRPPWVHLILLCWNSCRLKQNTK